MKFYSVKFVHGNASYALSISAHNRWSAWGKVSSAFPGARRIGVNWIR